MPQGDGTKKKPNRQRIPTSVALRPETMERLERYVKEVGGNRSEAIEQAVCRFLDEWEVAKARRELPKVVADLKALADRIRHAIGE